MTKFYIGTSDKVSKLSLFTATSYVHTSYSKRSQFCVNNKLGTPTHADHSRQLFSATSSCQCQL